MDHQSLEAQLADLQSRLDALEKQKRRRWGVLIAAVVLATGVAVAGPVTMTQFSPNTAAVAAQVNANFNNLNTRIEEVNTTLQTSIAAAAARTPSGTIAFFDVATGGGMGGCPVGWSEVVNARGRFIVGVPASGTVGGVSAPPMLTNLEDRPHAHRWAIFNTSLNWHSWDSSGASVAAVNWGDGMDSAGSGTYPFAPSGSTATDFYTEPSTSQLPYIQLLACKKT